MSKQLETVRNLEEKMWYNNMLVVDGSSIIVKDNAHIKRLKKGKFLQNKQKIYVTDRSVNYIFRCSKLEEGNWSICLL